jgi:MSHA biogenesis protein MshE
VRQRVRIGELLVKNQVITEEQLGAALHEQKKRRRRLGKILVELGFVEEDDLLSFLARQLGIPFIDLAQRELSRDVVLKLPETHARRFRAIVLEENPQYCLVGMADPTDVLGFDELSRILKRPIRRAFVREADLLHTIDRVYRRTEEIGQLAEELRDELAVDQVEMPQTGGEEDASGAPVARLLRSVFEDAVQIRASDIHIEPDEGVLRIRQRVDGVLQEHVMNEARIAPALVLRLKLMSGLDISEKRLPQDGRFNITVKDKSIDVRLSTMPVQSGESVVMRLLDQSGDFLKLDQLGMPNRILVRLRMMIHRPHGLILVTGPTGSGKTTTLYGALRELNEAEKKIITVEDPVEYRLPRINQVQINSKIDLTFARVLRSALRQDPDILMIGEMRDQETAEIGLRAAMTGHLVLSTLHTNDSISSPIRLVDMGAESYLAASSLRAVIAQRLVRKVCDSCPEPYEPDPRERAWLTTAAGPASAQIQYLEGRGCSHCNGTGYRGRIGIFEFLQMDEALTDALRRNDSEGFAAAARQQPDFRPLALCALDYASRGVTTLHEVFRMVEGLDDTLEPTTLSQVNPPSSEPGGAETTG